MELIKTGMNFGIAFTAKRDSYFYFTKWNPAKVRIILGNGRFFCKIWYFELCLENLWKSTGGMYAKNIIDIDSAGWFGKIRRIDLNEVKTQMDTEHEQGGHF